MSDSSRSGVKLEPKSPAATAGNSTSPSSSSSSKSKKSKNKRRGGKGGYSLNKDDIRYLTANTRYEEKEIREWFKGFRTDCPDGQLHRAKIEEIYTMILPDGNSSSFVDQIFRIFDRDGNGSIDFKEFMMATDMTFSGTPEEKLSWAFKMYDKDCSGTIELSEMTEVIQTLYAMEGNAKPDEEGMSRATRIFMELDINGDGELTCEEFVKGCMQDDNLVRVLQSGGLNPEEVDQDD